MVAVLVPPSCAHGSVVEPCKVPHAAPRICMVTGAYFPELSGGGLQARTLARALNGMAQCVVVTMTTDRCLPTADMVDGLPVYRIWVDPHSLLSKLTAAARLAGRLVGLRRAIDVVHLHGYTQKNWVVVIVALWLRKPLVQKLTSFGADDPNSINGTPVGRLQRWCYRQADRVVTISPAFHASTHGDPQLRNTAVLIANGVDLERFKPTRSRSEQEAIRAHLGFVPEAQIVLFVGFFSHDKDPWTLWKAWQSIRRIQHQRLQLVFLGATQSEYYEVDRALSERIRQEAQDAGWAADVHFVERTTQAEDYFRAADVFAMPSRREGLPNVLLEAMATGLPCIASRLPGITDWLIQDGVNGLLVEPGDAEALAQTLRWCLEHHAEAHRMGQAARTSVEESFDIRQVARAYWSLYDELLVKRSGAHPHGARR